jgi:hypothetical protein
MSKLGVSILSMIVGLAIGVLVGRTLFKDSPPKSWAPDTQHYYYHLNDSMAVRHTISISEGRLVHKVDTVAVESR